MPNSRVLESVPTGFEFIRFGAIGDESVVVRQVTPSWGIDGMLVSATVELFVPNPGTLSIRPIKMTVDGKVWRVTSADVYFEPHLAYE